MIKKTLEKFLPDITDYGRKLLTNIKLKKSYNYDFKRYKQHSRLFGNDTPVKMSGEITSLYHVIEKGLTMPDQRPGFGQEGIIRLCELCLVYLQKFGSDEQVQHAIRVILEYKDLHQNRKHELSPSVTASIGKLKQHSPNAGPCKQREITRQAYFHNKMDDFSKFAGSRASVRNFSQENIPVEKITKALELARNTPSACNRQTWRTYVYTNKDLISEILKIQGGNRGFGHLGNKLIVIAGEVGVFCGISERNQVFIDGGMYAMNVLYALHFNEIAACILNCSHLPEKDIRLRQLCGIKNSEVFICMVVCGVPPDNFSVAISKRYNLDKTNTLIT